MNYSALYALRFAADLTTIESVRAQDRLFASISHDMRQPCHSMSLLIPFIMEAMVAAEVEGMPLEEKQSLQKSQKADMRQLDGLVETLLALIEDFLFFSKLRQSPDRVPPSTTTEFRVRMCECVHGCLYV
jgi:signal transduction histidine kinase